MLCFLGFFVFGVLLRHWLDSHDEMKRRQSITFPHDGGATANSTRGY